MSLTHIENEQRLLATDPSHSFIIQAPAGSGKTELLTQRYLRLLSIVNEPEEIIAITFTRKAATEMRTRIINALNLSEADHLNNHQLLTYQLAQQALIADKKHQWNLLENPGRMRILTIDALCAQLCSQMPLLSRLTPQAEITEDSLSLYQQAVHSLFNSMEEDPEIAEAIKQLLLQIDNRAELAEQLMAELLAKREQWLALLITYHNDPEPLKAQLELGLKQIIIENLLQLEELFESQLKTKLFNLVQFSATHLSNSNDEHPLCSWLDLEEFPETKIEHHHHWKALTKLLLTEELGWRKSFDKRQGFPAEAKDKETKNAYKHYKEQIKALTLEISSNHRAHELLCNLAIAPPPHYNEEQWSLLKSIIKLLPRLVAELQLIFQQENQIDFIELSLAALRALGSEGNPTDLALYLDYQIKHLLIDEFQDTSLIQFKLIEQLIAQWQNDEGRSLFLVGDPMQSIYRFRNAEVGLFIRTQQQGIAEIKTKSLKLGLNFRSDPNIIYWLNQIFAQLFPQNADIALGAIPYSISTAAQENRDLSGVHYYPLVKSLHNATASTIIQIIRDYRLKQPEARIAILVRSRSQLENIIPNLHAAGLKFKAIELEALSARIEIEDLFSLTRALLHLGDRTAWLSILRAPWCGLTLADLLALAEASGEQALWNSLLKFNTIPKLSLDAQERLSRIVPILDYALSQKSRLSYSEWIKATWLALGGPACLDHEAQIANTEHFFELLAELEGSHNFSLSLLGSKLEKLYASADPQAEDTLQIMTIHKAKGLEFDHVILPHLESAPVNEASQLLRWLERPRLTTGDDLILAPIKNSRAEYDAIYNYLLHIEKLKLDYEMTRLFYVASSRAKLSLHLIAEFQLSDELQVKPPPKRSFMHLLWNFYQEQTLAENLINATNIEASTEEEPARHLLKRLSRKWILENLGTPGSF